MAFQIPAIARTVRLPGASDVAAPVPPPALRSIAAAGEGGQQLAQAGQQLSRWGERVLDEERAATAADLVSAGRAHWVTELRTRQDSAQPGAPGFTVDVQRDFEAWAAEQLAGAPGGAAGRWVQSRIAEMRASVVADAARFESQSQRQNRIGTFATALDRNRNTVLANPGQFGAVLSESLDTVRAMEVPPVDRERLERETRAGLAVSAAQGLIARNPAQAMAAITGPLAEHLDADRSASLIAQARARQDSMAVQGRLAQERSERQAERRALMAERIQGDEGFTRLHRGELSYEWLQQNRGNLNSNDYRALLRGLRGENATDRSEAVIDLTEQLDTLAPEDFQRQAGAALRGGELRVETYRSLVERNRQARRDDTPSSAYRQGRAYVHDGLDPGALGSGPQEMGLRLGRARALQEFDEWSAGNPQADADTAMRQADTIVRRYQIARGTEMRIGLPLPYGYAGERTGVDLGALEASRGRIAADLDAGTINQARAAREWEFLDRWEASMPRTPTAPQQRSGAPAPAPARAPAAAPPAAAPAAPAPAPAAAPRSAIPDPATARDQRVRAVEWLRVNDPALWRRLDTMSATELATVLTDAITRMQAAPQ